MALGFIKSLFSAPKVVDTAADIVKAGVDGIGKCFFTEQEKAEFTLEAGKMWIRVQEVIAGENTVRSMTRRILAIMILGTFLFFLIIAGAVWPWNVAYAMFLLSLAKELATLALAVGAFYFGVHLLRGLVNRGGEK